MKLKLLAGVLMSVGFAASANASKIFEWNDPVLGNYPPECSAQQTYGTGGGGGGYGYSFQYLYYEYTVQCPGHTVVIGRYWENYNGTITCDIDSQTPGYTTAWNNCDNWRVYD